MNLNILNKKKSTKNVCMQDTMCSKKSVNIVKVYKIVKNVEKLLHFKCILIA